ncbi:MAG: hypothetical protein ACU836_17250 [Gammaproteobacteria bacterium]
MSHPDFQSVLDDQADPVTDPFNALFSASSSSRVLPPTFLAGATPIIDVGVVLLMD